MLVRNKDGEWIRGAIAAKPPHFLSDEERAQNKVQSVSNLVIDIGARSAEEAKEAFGIRIGEPAVPATPFEYDEARDIMFGKGFDCRIGCAALIETMRLLSGMELDVDVIGVLSAQEEVGERGCKVAVNKVRPNIAIVYEGCPADDTFGEAYAMQTIMKKAPCSATWTNLLYATPASSVLRLIRRRKTALWRRRPCAKAAATTRPLYRRSLQARPA